MASLAIPLIEAAAARVLAALGVGVVAGAAGEAAKDAAKKRQEEADKAKSTPLAKVDAQVKAKCDTCPISKGTFYIRNFSVLRPWIEYQARICGLPLGPNSITEWAYNGKIFDGFNLANCSLIDAKGAYDQFFDDYGNPKAFWLHNVPEMAETITLEDLAARPAPPVNLEWFWQEPLSYRFFSLRLAQIVPRVVHHYQP